VYDAAAHRDRIDNQVLSDVSVTTGDVLIPGSGGAAATLLRSRRATTHAEGANQHMIRRIPHFSAVVRAVAAFAAVATIAAPRKW
jgi:hypothetical protein